VRQFKVGTQLEGCVADDELGHLYIGEEAVGIWKYGAEPDSGEKRTQVDKAGSGGHLVADVEGLTIAYGKDGTGYLIASSQGNNSYVVYRREQNNEYVKTFSIAASQEIDGVEDTDGIDVTMANLGPAFPKGVFIAQDGINDKGNQNFKLVPFHAIISAP
jgi:3-phytase